jgi:hypothetical protein
VILIKFNKNLLKKPSIFSILFQETTTIMFWNGITGILAISMVSLHIRSSLASSGHRFCVKAASAADEIDVCYLSDANGGVYVLPPKNGDTYKNWERYNAEEDGTFEIRNTGNGLCLRGTQPSGGYPGKVEAVSCDPTEKELNLRWKILYTTPGGRSQFVNVGIGNCLSSDGTRSYCEICNSYAKYQFLVGI